MLNNFLSSRRCAPAQVLAKMPERREKKTNVRDLLLELQQMCISFITSLTWNNYSLINDSLELLSSQVSRFSSAVPMYNPNVL